MFCKSSNGKSQIKRLFLVGLVAACAFSLGITGLAEAAPSTSRTLEASFKNPPDSARIWVYWFWLNGNITRGGITADLEAMKRAGVGGVLIMEVDQGTPVGPVAFMSDRWRELFKHMVAEAHRLGIEVNMNNRCRLERERRSMGAAGSGDAGYRYQRKAGPGRKEI